MDWQLIFKIIKWLVPAFIALILYKKFYQNPSVSLDLLNSSLKSLDWYWLPMIFIFSILNWGVETRKWQYLICKIELQSFPVAFKSVLAGVAVAQLLPYRTGEYLGRLAYVKDDNKIDAGILSVVGSFTQLLITLTFGSVAFFVIRPLEIPYSFAISFAALSVLLILGYYHLPQFGALRRTGLFITIRNAMALLKHRDMLRLISFSLLRYFLFLMPYAMLAIHFNLINSHNIYMAMLSVSCIYFLQTVSPNFILTDLAIRISVPALVFSGSLEASSGLDYLPGMIIYLFNIVIPMILGAVILISFKLKK